MEECGDSEDDDIEDSDSFFAYTTTSSSLTASESESEDNSTEESDDEQLKEVHTAATAEHFLMPLKRARTTGGFAYRQNQNKARQVNLRNILPDKTTSETNPSRNLNQWKDEQNIVKKIKFTATPGLKIKMESKKPLDFFRLFVTEELINSMVVETNRYAMQEINKQRPLRRSSLFKNWKPINSEDMRQFLGVLLHMGCVKLPSFEHYWSKNSLYRFPLFSRIMPRNKYQLMLRFLHFIDNEDSDGGRLCKIIGLIDHYIINIQ
ncbi:piggyBac transposable element-derived protein 4-like [Hydra vulgaris]|uniref:piggyBac transposable element-derived protein 4-like n=1 Tax=Hydra vulgaris TaxID=6087 RepID=UPI001F5F868A|nr:piggyBac transposable element-derived protein 4-like [Hydra vulgaris]